MVPSAVRTATESAAPALAAAGPRHGTPLLVLYGSNLGTAEELATRVADLAEVNGETFINNSSIGIYPYLVIARERLRQRHRLAVAPQSIAWHEAKVIKDQ